NSSCSDWLGYTLKRKLTNQENPLTPFFESHEKTTDMYHTSLILNDLRESFSGMKFYICIPY
ncbi:hypothetical protein AAH157_20530, partial [Phocaeicola vulgatus]|uniref:hypothetical protein n=1 Tax=Phocaeicola vulgatus TaxID=821 RepID=UPI0039B3B5D3